MRQVNDFDAALGSAGADPVAVELAETALTGPLQVTTTHRRSSGPFLTGGCVVRPAQSVLWPPPTPFRPVVHFPRSSVIGRHAPTTHVRRLSGRGGPPQFPPPLSERSAPHTPGSSSRLQSRSYTASLAFTPISKGSALPGATLPGG